MKVKILMGIVLICLIISGLLSGLDILGWVAIVSTAVANILLWSDRND